MRDKHRKASPNLEPPKQPKNLTPESLQAQQNNLEAAAVYGKLTRELVELPQTLPGLKLWAEQRLDREGRLSAEDTELFLNKIEQDPYLEHLNKFLETVIRHGHQSKFMELLELVPDVRRSLRRIANLLHKHIPKNPESMQV